MWSDRIGVGAGLGLVLGLVLAGGPVASASESVAMTKLIEVLHADGTISEDAYHALKAALAEDTERLASEVEQAATRASASVRDELQKEIEDASSNATVSERGGSFRLRSRDRAFTLDLGGRVHVDSIWYDQDRNAMANGPEVRRARLDFRGTVWDDWSYYAGFDMATGSVALRGMSVTYGGFERFDVSVGQIREPFGMEEITSSNSITFMERSAPSEIFAPGRHVGAAISASSDHWSTKFGVFWSGDPAGGDTDEEDGIDDRDAGWAATARATWAPLNESRRVIHFGAAGSLRSNGDLTELRYRGRPESHATDVRLVDSGRIRDVDWGLLYGAEAAMSLGPFFFQSEYFGVHAQRDGAKDLYFSGWDAQASWFLTGESRPYRTSRGVFSSVEPRRNFSRDGGIGAFEVALRFSTVDLDDAEVRGGQQDALSFGLNWYPNPNVRFMFNYVNVLDLDHHDSVYDDDEPSSFGLRSQITF